MPLFREACCRLTARRQSSSFLFHDVASRGTSRCNRHQVNSDRLNHFPLRLAASSMVSTSSRCDTSYHTFRCIALVDRSRIGFASRRGLLRLILLCERSEMGEAGGARDARLTRVSWQRLCRRCCWHVQVELALSFEFLNEGSLNLTSAFI